MQGTSISLLGRLANSGSNDDWQKLLAIYRPFITNVVRGYPTLESHAEDVAQEVMLVLLRELPNFERQRTGSFRAWLRNITINQIRAVQRKSKRFQQIAEKEQMEDLLSQLAEPASEASRLWDLQHDQAVLRQIMLIVRNDFQPSTWTVFEKHVVQGEAAAKVAGDLGISINTVFLAKSRILRRLRSEAAGLVEEW